MLRWLDDVSRKAAKIAKQFKIKKPQAFISLGPSEQSFATAQTMSSKVPFMFIIMGDGLRIIRLKIITNREFTLPQACIKADIRVP